MSTRGSFSTISFTWATTMPDLKAVASTMVGRVLGIWAGIEIAVAVGLNGGDQRDMRRQIHEIAGEQLDIGVDRAEFDLARAQRTRDAAAPCGPE